MAYCPCKDQEIVTCGSSNASPGICIADIKLMEGKKELCLAFSLSFFFESTGAN